MASTSDSSRFWTPVTPSDSASIYSGNYCNYIYVGASGDVTAMVISPLTGLPTATLFSGLAVGYHPIQTNRINATGTTASKILAAF